MNVKKIIKKLSSPPMEVVDQASCEEMLNLFDFAEEIREWHRQTVTAMKLFMEGTPGHDRAVQEMSLIEEKLINKIEELYVKFGVLFD